MAPGWSAWNTTGNVHVRTFHNGDGAILFYQWHNKQGHCTVRPEANSSRLNAAVVNSIVSEFEDSRRRSSPDVPNDAVTSLSTITLGGLSANNPNNAHYAIQSSTGAPNTDVAVSEGQNEEEDILFPLSDQDVRHGLERQERPVRWHWENASQSSMRGTSNIPSAYTVRHKREYKPGSIYSMVFAAPDGQAGSNVAAPHNAAVYVTLRPFVVFQRFSGHCLCVPIFSYGGKGLTNKKFTDDERSRHVVVFAVKTDPQFTDDEGMTHDPFRFFPDGSEILSPQSRIRLDMWHTLQYNTPTKKIGSIDRREVLRLLNCIREIISPASDSGAVGVQS